MIVLSAGGRELILGCRWVGEKCGPFGMVNATSGSSWDGYTYCEFRHVSERTPFSCRVTNETLVDNHGLFGKHIYVPLDGLGQQVLDDSNRFVLLTDVDGYFLHCGRKDTTLQKQGASAVEEKVDDGFFALD